jgi:hypothetical protein
MIISTSALVPVVPAGDAFNDGSAPHGSAQLTIAGNGAGGANSTYDSDDFTANFTSKVVTQNNRYGVPVRKFGIFMDLKGSSTWQFPLSNTVAPKIGDLFTSDVLPGVNFWVTEASLKLATEAFYLWNVTFEQKLN